jgi:hypothetical protein
MADPQDTPKFDDHLWRGGECMNIVQVSDRFTDRLKRGIAPEVVERSNGVTHCHRLRCCKCVAYLSGTAQSRSSLGRTWRIASARS